MMGSISIPLAARQKDKSPGFSEMGFLDAPGLT
jgi:hypothetical protein